VQRKKKWYQGGGKEIEIILKENEGKLRSVKKKITKGWRDPMLGFQTGQLKKRKEKKIQTGEKREERAWGEVSGERGVYIAKKTLKGSAGKGRKGELDHLVSAKKKKLRRALKMELGWD